MRRRTHKFIQAAAVFGGARDHRKPQIRGKLVEVISHALLFRLIEQIDADILINKSVFICSIYVICVLFVF